LSLAKRGVLFCVTRKGSAGFARLACAFFCKESHEKKC